VAHSLELLLDPVCEAAIRKIWQALDDAGLPSQVRVTSPTNRPHITLLAAERISAGVDDALRPLAARFPVAGMVGAALVFGGTRHTLARLIVPSAALLALQEEVYRLSLPYVVGEPFDHCRPGHWTAHATLGRRFTAEQIAVAMAVVNAAGTDLAGDIVGLRRWDSDRRIDHVLVG
jgi:hypothetical protein